jgi:hypothetical protein
MSPKEAEAIHLMSEFLADEGHWTGFCQRAESMGVAPKDIANSLNHVADLAGFLSHLTPGDCEP